MTSEGLTGQAHLIAKALHHRHWSRLARRFVDAFFIVDMQRVMSPAKETR
jgi:hypothetical protein